MRILLSIAVNAVALWATTFVPGITFNGTLLMLLVGGAVLGLFNLIIRPIAMFLSVPLLILTLGLFYFVLNGILLWLASFVIPGYRVSNIVAGILGGLVMAIVNWGFWTILGGKDREDD